MARSMAVSLAGALLITGGLAFSGLAQAAESYDNCNNFIDSLPATISTQGVWCLRKDVSTGIASGNAIRITTNNVTIDCNGFKIGGLAGGPASRAKGIHAEARQNITVRGCGIRGFDIGINIIGGAGHLVERNRLDHNLSVGIVVGTMFGPATENSVVRNNLVFDTGSPTVDSAGGISSNGADVIGNTISGVFAKSAGLVAGVFTGSGALVRGNRIRGIEATETGTAYGVLGATDARIEDNALSMAGAGSAHTGIHGGSGYCMDNTIRKFPAPMDSCIDAGGNASHL